MNSYENNIENIKDIFKNIKDRETRYLKIIEIGNRLPPFPEDLKTNENKVSGCQSITYLSSSFEGGILKFKATSDALISKGLVAILIEAYKDLKPSDIIKNPPNFLYDLQIQESLSPSRANGVLSMYEKMKEEALKYSNN